MIESDEISISEYAYGKRMDAKTFVAVKGMGLSVADIEAALLRDMAAQAEKDGQRGKLPTFKSPGTRVEEHLRAVFCAIQCGCTTRAEICETTGITDHFVNQALGWLRTEGTITHGRGAPLTVIRQEAAE